MNLRGGVTTGKILLSLVALIVVGGFVLALFSTASGGLTGSLSKSAGAQVPYNGPVFGPAATNGATNEVSNLFSLPNSGNVPPDNTVVVNQGSTVTVTSVSTTTTAVPPSGMINVTHGTPSTAGGLIEFSTNLQITTASPEQTASAISALAYTVGGYVAYQNTFADSANVVIRVPSADFQTVLNQIRAMGVFVSESSNSNDVRVQYTDLNATLTSLKAEQSDLLRFLNQSANITTTLRIESQLQQVNQQINDIESQILQMKTLVDYATINVTVTKTNQATLPTMTLSATPKTGMAPLSVTFNANVKGGAQPYIEIYNFGDGTSAQGQTVIHTFYTAGDYNVTVNVTDQEGNATAAWTMIRVTAASTQSGISAFFGNVSNLFLNVVEGIIEVAVVVLPLAAVGAAIIIPVQRHNRSQKDIKQS